MKHLAFDEDICRISIRGKRDNKSIILIWHGKETGTKATS